LAISYGYLDKSITLVVDNSYGKHSDHYTNGYGDIFNQLLGLPDNIHRIASVRQSYRPSETLLKLANAIPLNGDYIRKFPCNHMHMIDGYDSCIGWCAFHFSREIQNIIKPLLRMTYQQHSSCTKYIGPPLQPDAINILWHIRSGDVCPHCEDSQYYQSIYESILKIIMKAKQFNFNGKVNNIIMHTENFRNHALNLFTNIPNTVFYSHEDISHIICNFINTDILIATGSSFPSVMCYFTKHLKPILIEDIRIFAINEKAKYIYVTNEDDAFHMKNGKLLHDDEAIELIVNTLKSNGVFDRIKN
jgi:hypothetical protein